MNDYDKIRLLESQNKIMHHLLIGLTTGKLENEFFSPTWKNVGYWQAFAISIGISSEKVVEMIYSIAGARNHAVFDPIQRSLED